MAKYKKADNCGPVPYPDQSGRFLGEGEVSDMDDWEPYVALGYVVKLDDAVEATPDRQETPEELAGAVRLVEVPEKAPEKTVAEMAREAAAREAVPEVVPEVESVSPTVMDSATKAVKVAKVTKTKTKKKNGKKKGTKSTDVSGD